MTLNHTALFPISLDFLEKGPFFVPEQKDQHINSEDVTLCPGVGGSNLAEEEAAFRFRNFGPIEGNGILHH